MINPPTPPAPPTLYFRLDNAGHVLDCKVDDTVSMAITPTASVGCPLSEVLPGLTASVLAAALAQVVTDERPVYISLGSTEPLYEALFMPPISDQIALTVRPAAVLELTVSESADGKTHHNQNLVQDVTHQQLQEIQQEVLQQIRDQVWRMQSAEDIEKVLEAVYQGMRQLEIPFDECGINLVERSEAGFCINIYSITEADEIWTGQIKVEKEPGLSFWRATDQVLYRRDLAMDDPYQERASTSRPVRSVCDVPFAKGTLAVNSLKPEAFSAADIALLESLTTVLDEGFMRLDDLREMERRNRIAISTG